jgi:hypothetical protein
MAHTSKITMLLLMIVIIGIYFLTADNQLNVGVTNTSNSSNLNHAAVIESNQQNNLGLSVKQKLMGDEANRAEIRSWFTSRGTMGFSGKNSQHDYAGLDRSTLEKMLNDGNISTLFSLIYNDDFVLSRHEIFDYIEKAAIWGSTDALLQASINSETYAIGSGQTMTHEEREKFIVDAFAYLRTAELRGDWWPSIQSKDRLLKTFNSFMTEEVRLEIDIRSNEIYNDLEQKRISQGLGAFDNSVPESVIEFYGRMIDPNNTQMLNDMRSSFAK